MFNQNLKYKENDLVEFTISADLKGIGEVVGLASIELPIIGHAYILRVVTTTGNLKIPNDHYPFSHIICNEVMMKCAQ